MRVHDGGGGKESATHYYKRYAKSEYPKYKARQNKRKYYNTPHKLTFGKKKNYKMAAKRRLVKVKWDI